MKSLRAVNCETLLDSLAAEGFVEGHVSMIGNEEELDTSSLGFADRVIVNGPANASTLAAGVNAKGERSEALVLLVPIELADCLRN